MSAPPADFADWTDEELEEIAAQGAAPRSAPAQDEFADYSDEELEQIAKGGQIERERLEYGIEDPAAVAYPEGAARRRHTPEEIRANARMTAELGAGLALTPLTGGVSLFPRLGLAAAAGAGTSLLSETFDPSEDIPAAVRRALKTAAGFAAGEGIGSAVGAGLKRLARGVFATDDPVRLAAQEAIEQGGGVLPPAQATGRNSARLAQGLAEQSGFGASRLQAAREGAQEIGTKAIREFVDDYPSRFSREELGSKIQEVVEGRVDAFRELADEAYKRVDEAFDAAIQGRIRATGAVVPAGTKITTQPTVSLESVKQSARQLLERARQGLASAESTRVLSEILEKPDTVTFQGAQRLRSDLLSVTRTGTELIAGQAKGAAKRISMLVDDAMEASAREAGPEVLAAWREANRFYREGARTFNSALVRKVAHSTPDVVVDAILKSNKPTTVRIAKHAVKNQAVWKAVQREYLERLITKEAIDAPGEVLKGQKILTKLRQFGSSAEELLGASKVRELEKLARTLQVTQEFTGKGAGGVGIRGLTDVGALSLFLTGRPGAAALAVTPAVVGYLFTNPTTVRLLTRGFQAPAGSAAAARAFAQLSQIAVRQMTASEPRPNEARVSDLDAQ